MRLFVSHFGYNYDFESYKLVATAVENHITPWETYRYNYGVMWSLVLVVLDFVSVNNEFVFRGLIIMVLTLSDVYIASVIAKKYGLKFGLIFLFNPISIIVSGYYNQFDNLALAIALAAVVNIEKRGSIFKSCLLLSLSLITKHNFILFLFWILISKKLKREKYIISTVPILCFILHFVPFAFISSDVRRAILSNVFLYWSNNNAPLWQLILQNDSLINYLSDNNQWHHGRVWMILFFLSLSILGILSRSNSITTNFFSYSIGLVLFASAITSQFFAIAAIGASAYFNLAFILFFTFGTLWLLAEPSGLQLPAFIHLVESTNFDGWKALPLLLVPGISLILLRRHSSAIKKFL